MEPTNEFPRSPTEVIPERLAALLFTILLLDLEKRLLSSQ
jgi:diphthamide biosynthesis methyltransferase